MGEIPKEYLVMLEKKETAVCSVCQSEDFEQTWVSYGKFKKEMLYCISCGEFYETDDGLTDEMRDLILNEQ